MEATENKIEQAEVVAEKLYHFRRLGPEDIFLMLKIIGKIGVNEIKALFANDSVKNSVAGVMAGAKGDNAASNMASIGLTVALEVANLICNKLPECRGEIYQLLAQTSGKNADEIKDMDGVLFFEMVIDFILKEEFPDFIKVVSKRF